MQDIRCENCGRMLAKESDGILHIRTAKNGEEVLIQSGRVHFVCPGVVYTIKGKIRCRNTTRVDMLINA